MYWYEKDYIMRLIHGIAQMLAYLFFGTKETELPTVMGQKCRESNDYLRGMVDSGLINEAEDKLFELLKQSAWDEKQKVALAISFYDYVNNKDDDFLAAANFSRDEIASGLEDAMHELGLEIPEYLKI